MRNQCYQGRLRSEGRSVLGPRHRRSICRSLPYRKPADAVALAFFRFESFEVMTLCFEYQVKVGRCRLARRVWHGHRIGRRKVPCRVRCHGHGKTVLAASVLPDIRSSDSRRGQEKHVRRSLGILWTWRFNSKKGNGVLHSPSRIVHRDSHRWYPFTGENWV